jgi:hypothetical protein
MCTNNTCLIHYLIHNTYNSFNECVLMYFTSPICVFVASPFIVHYIPISLVIQDIPLLNVDPQYRKMSKSSNDGIQHTLISTVSMFKKISG